MPSFKVTQLKGKATYGFLLRFQLKISKTTFSKVLHKFCTTIFKNVTFASCTPQMSTGSIFLNSMNNHLRSRHQKKQARLLCDLIIKERTKFV